MLSFEQTVFFMYQALYRLEKKADLTIALLRRLQRKMEIMSAELDALEAEVTENTNLQNSAVTLINGLAAQIAAAANDPVKLNALSASLQASSDALAAAITANTPAPTA